MNLAESGGATSVSAQNTQDLQTLARLTDGGFYAAEPYDVYARLRAEAPVFWFEEGEIWGLSKYADIKFVHGHPELFSSMYGLDPTRSMPPEDASCPVTDMPRRAELRRWDTLRLAGEGNEVLVASDPPRHSWLRRLVKAAFTPRLVASLEPAIRARTRDAIATIQPGEVTDWVAALAQPVPLRVIAEMLGVPSEEWDTFGRWSDAIADLSGDMQDLESPAALYKAGQCMEFAAYFGDQLAQRRSQPRDDLLTAMQREVDGEVLGEAEQLMMTTMLLLAGNETTQVLLSGGAKLLAEHPDQRAVLAGCPEMIPNAIEEMLRCVTPVVVFARTAKERTEIRDKVINRGDFIVSMFSSANRDEDIWSDPEVFDVARKPDSAHVAFGYGTHFCLGTALARLEARVVFEEVLAQFPEFELAGESCRVASSNAIPRYPSMPIVFGAPAG